MNRGRTAIAARRLPQGLHAAGRRFWKATVQRFDLTDDDERLLEATCRTLDEINELEATPSDAQVTGNEDPRQQCVNPAFLEVRAQRVTLEAMWRAIDLGASAEESADRSKEARKLVLLRWHQHTTPRGEFHICERTGTLAQATSRLLRGRP